MNTKKRIDDFDFIKGVLIIFVIWGHCCMYLSGPDYEKNALTTYIRLFQMPLFIFISGYFQKSISTVSEGFLYLKKSLVHIGVPLASWIIVAYLLKLTVNAITIQNVFLAESTHGIVSLFWYLACLIMCQVCFDLLGVVSIKWPNVGRLLLYSSPFWVMLFPIDLFHFSFLWIFFLLGYSYRNHLDKIQMNQKAQYALRIALLAFVIVGGGIFQTKYTFYNISNSLLANISDVKHLWGILVYRYALYLSATYSAYWIIRNIYQKILDSKIARMIVSVGRETLVIYTAHVAILSTLYSPIVKHYLGDAGVLPNHPFCRYYILASVFTILLCMLCYIISKTLNKNSLTRKLFLGK